MRAKLFLAWAVEMFGPIAMDRQERVARFVEEAIELAHAEAMPLDKLRRIMQRVYSRPKGDTAREIGQAQVTLECLAESIQISADDQANLEWERVQSIPPDEWGRRHAAKVEIGIAGE